MARIPEHEVERLKKEISVQRLAEAQGVKLTRHGADLVGKCPFHDDRTPSLVITPAKNLWHCLGACNTGGTAIDWVMKAQGRELPPCGRAAESGPFSFSRRSGAARETEHGAQAAAAGRAGGRRPGAAVAGRGLLQRSVEAVAGGAEISGVARPEIFRDHRPLQAGLRQPDAGVSAAGEEPRRRRGDARTVAEAGHLPGERARALQRLHRYPGVQQPRAKWSRCMGGRSRRICARERRTICIFRGRTGACGTKRRWSLPKKSSCARR